MIWRKGPREPQAKNGLLARMAGGEHPPDAAGKEHPMYQHILVPLDGSATAERGLREAMRLAAEQKGKLRLLHVIDNLPMLMDMAAASSFETTMREVRAYGEALLAKSRKTATEAGVETETVLREVMQGRVANVVVDEAGKSGCDLIVMGTHGRRGFSRLALGSDADLVVRSSPVPVLLVRNEPVDT
ncbi:universal stress protein [Variovorax sp. LjRoot84]